MLKKTLFSKDYENFIKVKCFIDDIKSSDKIVQDFVDADIKKQKTLVNLNRFDKKSKSLLTSLLNGSQLDSKVSKFVDSVTFKDLSSIDTIIDKCINDLKQEFDQISTKIVYALDEEFPFPDNYVEEIKIEISKLISTKVGHALYKRKKIVSLDYKDFDYKKQIKAYTDFIEKIVDERIKSITITIPPSKIIVQGTGTATNAQPIILSNDIIPTVIT